VEGAAAPTADRLAAGRSLCGKKVVDRNTHCPAWENATMEST